LEEHTAYTIRAVVRIAKKIVYTGFGRESGQSEPWDKKIWDHEDVGCMFL
jgi:hypothetical protein